MEALCLPVRALARRASEGSGLERTETLPVELTGGKCEDGGWGGEVVMSTMGESGAVRWKICSQHTAASEAVFWLGGT